MLNREIELLLSIDHPNVVKLYEVFEDAKFSDGVLLRR